MFLAGERENLILPLQLKAFYRTPSNEVLPTFESENDAPYSGHLKLTMCGIYGIIQQPPPDGTNGNLADQMRDAISHRGPDHSGRYTEPGIVLGCNRLAIVDLDSGNQPIFNEDGSLVIVYNGEIYNHPEIKTRLESKGHIFKTHSDTETILHAYEEYGPECVKHFNGMFAFAIWDTRKRTLFLARDRHGIKPLYLAKIENGVAFASEAKALFPVLSGAPQPNWMAIYRYFTFGYVPSNDSPFQGIEKFPPAHTAVLRDNRLQYTRYWKLEYGKGNDADFKEATAKVYELVNNAVCLELMSDVDVGVFLSGGLDSSAVALFAKKNYHRNIHSFSMRFEEVTHDESGDACAVARHLGLNHHEFLFSKDVMRQSLSDVAKTLDEPFGDPTVLPLFALSKFTKEYVKVVLTGFGGDEIFAGYPTLKAHLLASVYRKFPGIIKNGLIPSVARMLPVSDKYMSLEFRTSRFIQGTNLPPELQHFIWMGYFDEKGKNRLFTREITKHIQEDTLTPVEKEIATMTEKDIISRIMHLDATFYLRDNGLFEVDRMTMAASLEARVPLLNNTLTDYVNSLPAAMKMKGGKLKGLLRTVLKDHLPERIINKPKKGFGPPASAWFRGEFLDVLENVFSAKRVHELGIFNHDEITRLINEHKSRRADHGRNLWTLLGFQLWYDNFILNESTIFS